MFSLLLTLLSAVLTLASPLPPDPFVHHNPTSNGSQFNTQAVSVRSSALPPRSGAGTDCFPAIGFRTPSQVPGSTEGWWCDPVTEYAFVGFSYEVTACGYAVF
jgi:hypothetical protein